MAGKERRERRRVLFSGNVQGVGFRFRTSHVAQAFAVEGFVRNLSDGRVELVAEGEEDELDRFVAALQKEMERYIDTTQAESSSATGEFRGFQIRA